MLIAGVYWVYESLTAQQWAEQQVKIDQERLKLLGGEISTSQFCANIGSSAQEEPECQH